MFYNCERARFIDPPRPEVAIPIDTIGSIERRGTHIAQLKMNGTYNEIIISPEKTVTCFTRHNTPHKAWSPNLNTLKPLIDAAKGWTVFCAELLHSKGSGIRDTNYVHDILVYDDQVLVGKTYLERWQMIASMFEETSNIHLARIHFKDFRALFEENKDSPLVEGLVFKRFAHPYIIEAPSQGMCKVRKLTKNYGF